jgi:hypothetical protein
MAKPKNKQPTRHVYFVLDDNRRQNFWARIGAVFPHEDGDGETIVLDVVPANLVDGKLVLRKPKAKDAEAGAQDGMPEDGNEDYRMAGGER